ncbi:MAG: ATP phosphoribosyltransferase regulatory subunit [Clostridia bacterium]|nr:ATP phosphoribosyltransferase regulatory subunit [Clostridia bacterium]
MLDEKILKEGEAAVWRLRSLYKKYGYMPFKMSKFEEYDLYVRNKDFLQGNGVITFSDTGGELLALKPDVTLSIIKNTTDRVGCVSKVYYDENVYRISGATSRFKEIMQTGIEAIGDIDGYSRFEVVLLAAKSLEVISDRYVLDISHMGIIRACLSSVGAEGEVAARLSKLIAEKNSHEIGAILKDIGADEAAAERLISLTRLYGNAEVVLPRLKELCEGVCDEAYAELSELSELISKAGYGENVRIDFSVINNMSYYNGIVFRGFIDGIPEGVLAGGEYGALMESMGRSSEAIGFAIYLDMLEGLSASRTEYDVDVLLLYDKGVGAAAVSEKVAELVGGGMTVSAQCEIPEKLRARQVVRL